MEYTEQQVAEYLEGARILGREEGENAGSWAADGNTSHEHIRCVLAMIENGDPQAYDYLPRRPSLSGEWADEITCRDLVGLVTGSDEVPDWLDEEIAQAWEDGVAETFEIACVETLCAFLPAADDFEPTD